MEHKDDPLWQALTRAVDRVKQRPHHILVERPPNDSYGLDCETINRLVTECGLSDAPILVASSDPQNVPERLLYPDFDNSVEWYRIGPVIGPIRTAVVEAVVERLEAWRQKRADQLDVAHSSDFRSLKWFGKNYEFTAKQSPVVKMLYEAWQNGTPAVGDETLLLAVDHEAPPDRLGPLFQNHPAWGVVIVSGGTKGTHRLVEPQK